MEIFTNFFERNIRCEILCIMWLLYFWNLYLSLRQRKLIQRLVNLPESVQDLMTKDEYNKARLYALDNNSFSLFRNLFANILHTIYILTYTYYYYWEWSVVITKKLNMNYENDILVSAVCIFTMILITDIINLPLVIYSIFVLEQKHGFNKQTPKFFIKDQLLKFIVSQVIAIPLACGMIWIIKNSGDYFFIHLWAFVTVVTIIMMILYPQVIAPLFDKYYPLPEGQLKEKIEALAASVNFPLYKLFIVEGSKRSSHSNAYLYGFFKHKRIVLFDTLVKEYYKPDESDAKKDQGCETDEVIAVVAHELAHWKYNHAIKGFLLMQGSVIISFITFAKLLHYTPIYAAFGFKEFIPIYFRLIIVLKYILLPLQTVMNFISVVISRKFEFQADRFAAVLGYGDHLKKALIKLQKDNLAYPIFDKLYSSWFHNHPPILERLAAVDKAN